MRLGLFSSDLMRLQTFKSWELGTDNRAALLRRAAATLKAKQREKFLGIRIRVVIYKEHGCSRTLAADRAFR